MRTRLNTNALTLACLVVGALIAFGAPLPDVVIYNRSASMPVGFYVRLARAPRIGDAVTVRARDVAAAYAETRNFNDAGDRFLKRIAAGDGDIVCAASAEVRVNGEVVASRMQYDRQGRALPSWEGCFQLSGRYLLLGDSADSFDGRYWGPVDARRIEAAWRWVGSKEAR